MHLPKFVLVGSVVLLGLLLTVGCGRAEFSVGGSVTGLSAGGLILSMNGETNIELSPGATNFLFETKLRNGQTYDVTILQQPGGGALTAEVRNGSGVITETAVDNVSIVCTLDDTALFTDSGLSLEPCELGDAAIFDADGNGNKDLFIVGDMGSHGASTMVYTNNGGLDFAAGVSGGLPGLKECSVAAADIDGDGDIDLALTGIDDTDTRYSRIYANDGTGIFSNTDASLTAMEQGVVATGDADGDGFPDLFLSGTEDGSYTTDSMLALLYTNDGNGGFADSDSTFGNVIAKYADFADADGDGDLDLFCGGISSPTATTDLYLNDGAGSFTKSSQVFTGTAGEGGFLFADDNDSLDIYLFGAALEGSVTAVYLNDGDGGYTLVENNFIEVTKVRVAAADVDADGDEDLVVAGLTPGTPGEICTTLYLNDGRGLFTTSDCALTGAYDGSVDLADVDGDGDNDLLITGTGADGAVAVLYENMLN